MTPEPSATDIAYLAGFFDGEGMVNISKSSNHGANGRRINPSYVLTIAVGNTCAIPMDWIVEHFGGWILQQKASGLGYRTPWIWKQKGTQAKDVLVKLMPHLTVKKAEAVVAIEFQERQSAEKNRYAKGRYGPVPRSTEERAYKEVAKLKLHELKLLDSGVPVHLSVPHSRRKLSEADVSEIRALYKGRETPQRIIAARYGVSRVTINDIINRSRAWRDRVVSP